MSKDTPKPTLKDFTDQGLADLRRLRRYRLAAFLLFVILLYGFVLLRINALSNAQPSQDAVTSQVQTAHVLHIDQSVISQLQSLQNNSVNVRTLFEQARNNPFQ